MDPWTLPTAGLQIYKSRSEIASVLAKINNRLRGEKAIIAVTGMPGVGKTVLVDHLAGAGLKDSYRPPGKSRGVERGLRRAKGLRLNFRTIPGQVSPIRIQGLDDLFNAKRPVAGLIHVVANGYSDIRAEFARAQLEREMSLEDFRTAQFQAEIHDLETTLSYARGAMARGHRPFWVLVAVNKVDLWSSDEAVAEARRRYTDPAGEFATAIGSFVNQVGSDNVQWEALPVSTWSSAFRWGDQQVPSMLDREVQLQTLGQLAHAIEDHARA
jgi:hypothetical protein